MALIDKLTAIADAIRGKTGGTALLTLDDMAAAIAGISSGGGGGSGLAYDMGEFVPEADTTAGANTYISHNLGEKPGFILVWTDDYVGVTNPYDNITALGFVWFNQIMGLENWFSGSKKGEGTTVNFTQGAAAGGMNIVKPTSATYTLKSDGVSAESFMLVKSGNTTYYRGGTTYKYFVSKAWWNIGGVASAE